MLEAAFICECLTLILLLIYHDRERRAWQNERKDLYTRIQAGSLQEYKQSIAEPVAPVVKDREQRVSEEAADKGLQRADLQFPPQWR